MAVRIPVYGKSLKRERKRLTKEQKHNYILRTVFVLLILLAALLQNVPHMFPTIFGAHAFLLLPLTVCMAMFERDISGTVYGILAGALWDVSTGFADGFYALYFMVAITAVCLLMNYLLRNNLVTALILSASVILLYCIIHWLVFVIARGTDGGALEFVTFYLPSALYTFAFTPVFYIFIRNFLKRLRDRYPKNSVVRRP